MSGSRGALGSDGQEKPGRRPRWPAAPSGDSLIPHRPQWDELFGVGGWQRAGITASAACLIGSSRLDSVRGCDLRSGQTVLFTVGWRRGAGATNSDSSLDSGEHDSFYAERTTELRRRSLQQVTECKFSRLATWCRRCQQCGWCRQCRRWPARCLPRPQAAAGRPAGRRLSLPPPIPPCLHTARKLGARRRRPATMRRGWRASKNTPAIHCGRRLAPGAAGGRRAEDGVTVAGGPEGRGTYRGAGCFPRMCSHFIPKTFFPCGSVL